MEAAEWSFLIRCIRGLAELIIVGSGIQIGRDLTESARQHIRSADKVFYLSADPIAAAVIEQLNSNAESLHTLYGATKPRLQTYEEMTGRIVHALDSSLNVCVVAYGHPGLFALPMHRSIERARQAGHRAVMLPAVSSIDCLFADLGFDPAEYGVQIYDATDFLTRPRKFDPSSALILLQIAIVGERCSPRVQATHRLDMLVERLTSLYGADHDAIIYGAAKHIWGEPSIQPVTMRTLKDAKIDHGSTLFVRPIKRAAVDEEITHFLEQREHARKN